MIRLGVLFMHCFVRPSWSNPITTVTAVVETNLFIVTQAFHRITFSYLTLNKRAFKIHPILKSVPGTGKHLDPHFSSQFLFWMDTEWSIWAAWRISQVTTLESRSVGWALGCTVVLGCRWKRIEWRGWMRWSDKTQRYPDDARPLAWLLSPARPWMCLSQS